MRISTKEERQKQSYIRQEVALYNYSQEKNIEYIEIFREDVSGKSFENRKEWNKLERLIKEGDTIVFKDISRFTRETENGYKKYMELMNKGITLIFIDNLTISTPYIKRMLDIAEEQNLIAKITLENTVKLLLMVELDRVEQERLITVKRIRDGIKASKKKSGRKKGQVDKLTDELQKDIANYLQDRTIKQTDLMDKHNISRNTLRKYIKRIQEQTEDKKNV
ncbi:resolvase [Dorea sp. OM02-2LB]|nr:resolvase [Dorea sp. OM02-2LB]